MTEKPLHEKKISELVHHKMDLLPFSGVSDRDLKEWAIAVVKEYKEKEVSLLHQEDRDGILNNLLRDEFKAIAKFLIYCFELKESDFK